MKVLVGKVGGGKVTDVVVLVGVVVVVDFVVVVVGAFVVVVVVSLVVVDTVVSLVGNWLLVTNALRGSGALRLSRSSS